MSHFNLKFGVDFLGHVKNVIITFYFTVYGILTNLSADNYLVVQIIKFYC
jgi:hypothetical protein